MARVLNIGSINLDEVFTVRSFPLPGETIASEGFARHIGGKGNNQSVALAKAGAETHHAGKVGADGRAPVDNLAALGVDVSRIAAADEPTGRAFIQVRRDGQNTIVLHGGANMAIGEADVDAFLAGWGKGDAALFQNEISCLPYALSRAKALGLRVYLNPSPINAALDAADLSLADCLILNEVEAAALSGAAEGEGRMAALRRRFPDAELVLTLGKEGVEYSGPDGTVLRRGIMEAAVVDTTAAGDTFTGFFIAARLRGAPPALALDEATAAAALCVSRPGAAESIPDRARMLARLAEG